jgi:hypothetical protein
MRNSEIINKVHGSIIIYLLTGWIFESQRKYLVFFLPTIQFQFLVNKNLCILTQLEKKYLLQEKKEDHKKDITTEKEEEIKYDSFTDKKLKEYNIHISPEIREYLINGLVYGSFMISYYLM